MKVNQELMAEMLKRATECGATVHEESDSVSFSSEQFYKYSAQVANTAILGVTVSIMGYCTGIINELRKEAQEYGTTSTGTH